MDRYAIGFIVACIAIGILVIFEYILRKKDREMMNDDHLSMDDFTMKSDAFRASRLMMFQSVMDLYPEFKRITHLPGVGAIVYRSESRDLTLTLFPMRTMPIIHVKEDGYNKVKHDVNYQDFVNFMKRTYGKLNTME